MSHFRCVDHKVNDIKFVNRIIKQGKERFAPSKESEQVVKDMALLLESGLFDREFYLKQYPDVASAGIDPLKHFVLSGWSELRNPSLLFNTGYYLERYPDVRKVGMNPLLHYLLYGKGEGRFISLYYERCACGQFIDIFEISNGGERDEFLLDKIQLDAVYHLNQHVEQEVHVSILNGQLSFSQDDKPQVSIIIPVYNNIDYTLRCIASLKRNITPSISYEVIIVDDMSSDGTEDILLRIDGIILIKNETNLGFVDSCNRGAQNARGEFVVFLNNDTLILPGWVEEMIQTFTLIPDTGLVGSMLLYPDGRLQEAGGIIWRDGSGWNYGHRDRPYNAKYLFARDVDYCSGASVMLRRDLFNSVGCFSKDYSPGYYEDTDLAFKIREKGYRTIYQPFSRVIHFEGVTSGTDLSAGMKKYQVTNREKFIRRWQDKIADNAMPEEKQYYYQDRHHQKHVLIIDACTPTPDQDSGSNDTVIHMRFLQQAGFRITFIAGANLLHYGKYTETLQRMGIECLYTPEIFSLQDYLKEEGWRFDLVWVYRWTMMDSFVDDIKQFAPKAKIVFDTVDLHFLRMHREAELLNDQSKMDEASIVKKKEVALMTKVDKTIVISDFEKTLLSQEVTVDSNAVTVLPMCREIPGCFQGFSHRERTVVFIGSFQHPPNLDAVEGFIENIWPLVTTKIPDLRFQIVGSKAHEFLGTIKADNVEVLGFVEDLSGLLNKCLMTVAPLRYGAGVKGKTLSSLSHGVPCVMSTVAHEGTAFENKKHCIVADKAEDYVNAISLLASDEEQWKKISCEGLQLMKENYSLEGVQQIFHEILNDLEL